MLNCLKWADTNSFLLPSWCIRSSSSNLIISYNFQPISSHLLFVIFHCSKEEIFFCLPAVDCGGAYTADQGVIISPHYPNPYPHDAQCVWTITVPVGEVITFNVTNIDLETHGNCLWDFVEVRPVFQSQYFGHKNATCQFPPTHHHIHF